MFIRQGKKQKKGKSVPKPKLPDHPLWAEFEQWIVDGIHFNYLPFDQMFNMTAANKDEWKPYWDTFLHGYWMGLEFAKKSVTKTLNSPIDNEQESIRKL